jgi:hypothetical protein
MGVEALAGNEPDGSRGSCQTLENVISKAVPKNFQMDLI